MISELLEAASKCLALDKVLRFDRLAIGGQGELGLLACSRWTCNKRGERPADLAGVTDSQVNIVALEQAAIQIALVGTSLSETLDRRLLVPEGDEELVRELSRIEGHCDEGGDGFFNLDRVHRNTSAPSAKKGSSPVWSMPRSPPSLFERTSPKDQGRPISTSSTDGSSLR